MDENEVFELLADLRMMIERSKPVLGNSGKRTIELIPVMNMIARIEDALPRELMRARQVVRMEDDIIAQAEREADNIVAQAEREAESICSQQEIVRLAEQKRDQIITAAHEEEMTMRYGAYQYTEDMFNQLQANLERLMDNVDLCRESLQGKLPQDSYDR